MCTKLVLFTRRRRECLQLLFGYERVITRGAQSISVAQYWWHCDVCICRHNSVSLSSTLCSEWHRGKIKFAGRGCLSRLSTLCSCHGGYILHVVSCTGTFRFTEFCIPVIFFFFFAVPFQIWSGSEVSKKLGFPDFMTSAQVGGKVVSLTHRLHLPPGNSPGTHLY